MSQSPYPYPPSPYYAPPGVGPTAKYAGILLLVMGAMALLMGGCVMGAAYTPGVESAEELEQFRTELDRAGVSLKAAFIIMGGFILAYAIPAIVMGVILIRARSKAPAIVAIVLVSLASLPMLLAIVAGLAQGRIAESAIWVMAAMLHGLLIMWLVQALRVAPPAPPMPGPYAPPQQPRPMQGYQYQPPKQDLPPPPRDGAGV